MVVMAHSITGILQLLNKTPIDWYSKKQVTRIFAPLYDTTWLGVMIRDTSYMFGDNKTVVDSATTLHAKLHKHHNNTLSFHRILHEAIAAKIVAISHLAGECNPVDIWSRHWG
jgi:hypothetical protein